MNHSPVRTLVAEQLGLDPDSLGTTVFPKAVAGRMAARGVASEAMYASLLRDDAEEWRGLVGQLVVAETWFFRGGRALFDRLAGEVQRQANTRGDGGPVRILSIPCSTGEEPYSLAIALAERGVAGSAFQIDGVDVAMDTLARAEAGVYGAFSFREDGLAFRDRYFQTSGEQRWEVRPEIRRAVRFMTGNILSPDLLNDQGPYEMIICRNLFIYLTASARKKAIETLDRLLAPTGWLCLSPAEADRLPAGRFQPCAPGEPSVYCRSERAEQSEPGRAVGSRLVVRPLPPRTTQTQGQPLLEPVSPSVVVPQAETARELADRGRLDEALVQCLRETASPAATATDFGLLGVLLLARAREDEAVVAFRKALYLDPGQTDALMQLALLADRKGDRTTSAALRARLARAEGVKS